MLYDSLQHSVSAEFQDASPGRRYTRAAAKAFPTILLLLAPSMAESTVLIVGERGALHVHGMAMKNYPAKYWYQHETEQRLPSLR
jgi:hypothetical protein